MAINLVKGLVGKDEVLEVFFSRCEKARGKYLALCSVFGGSMELERFSSMLSCIMYYRDRKSVV